MLKLSSLFAATVAMFLFSGAAFAAGDAVNAATTIGSGGLGALGAGLAVAIAAHGCGMAQGRLAGSALEGMARNPQASGDIRTSMMIALAFPESLVLFCFAIAFLIIGTI
jgi:F-type H+-transporting ATPase subunit c